jgi:UrcA family protein
MYIKSTASRRLLAAGALATCALLLAGGSAAKEFDVKVAIPVDTRGIDLKQLSGAQEMYRRIEHAANVACTYANRVDVKPVANVVACREEAVGNAVRSANSPLLAQVYLENHTLRQAATYGIQIPRQLASK